MQLIGASWFSCPTRISSVCQHDHGHIDLSVILPLWTMIRSYSDSLVCIVAPMSWTSAMEGARKHILLMNDSSRALPFIFVPNALTSALLNILRLWAFNQWLKTDFLWYLNNWTNVSTDIIVSTKEFHVSRNTIFFEWAIDVRSIWLCIYLSHWIGPY